MASKGGNKMSLAELVMIKLNHIAKNRNARNVHLTVERLHDVLDKHEEQATGELLKVKVARERQLMSFLNDNGLGKYAVAVLRQGIGSIEELRAVPVKDLIVKSKFAMTKADCKRLAAASASLPEAEDNNGGGGGGGGGDDGSSLAASAPSEGTSSVVEKDAVGGGGAPSSLSPSAAAMSSEATKAMELLRAVIFASGSELLKGNVASWQEQSSSLSSWQGVVLDGSGAKVLELDLSHCSLSVGNGGLAALRPSLRLLSNLTV